MTKELSLEAQRIQVRDSIQLMDVPTGFGWNVYNDGIKIFKDGPNHYRADVDARSKVSSDAWSGPEYWVDPINGVNTNNGLSVAAPVKSLWKARYLLEASVALGGIAHVKSDPTLGYAWITRNDDFNDTAGAGGSAQSSPTKPMAVMGYGGQVYMGAVYAGGTWVFDATSKAYSTSRSAVACVLDVTGYSRFGVFKRLIRIAGGADLAATRTAIQTDGRTGIYAVSTANDLCIRLDNDAVVNDTNCKVCLTASALKTGTPDLYMSGINLVGGGASSTVNNSVAAAHNIVFEDMDASFGGADLGAAANSWATDNMTGLLITRRCSGFSSLADLGNGHGTTGALKWLDIDFTGQDAGHAGASPATASDQISTIHDSVIKVSLMTNGKYSSGCCKRNINASQEWELGSEYGYDRGDLALGGAIPSTGISIEDTAKYWGDGITIRGCQRTFNVSSTAQVYLRNPIEYGGVRSGAGVINTY